MSTAYTIVFEFAIVGYGSLPCSGFPTDRATSPRGGDRHSHEVAPPISCCAPGALPYYDNITSDPQYVHPGVYARGRMAVSTPTMFGFLVLVAVCLAIICNQLRICYHSKIKVNIYIENCQCIVYTYTTIYSQYCIFKHATV